MTHFRNNTYDSIRMNSFFLYFIFLENNCNVKHSVSIDIPVYSMKIESDFAQNLVFESVNKSSFPLLFATLVREPNEFIILPIFKIL